MIIETVISISFETADRDTISYAYINSQPL